MNQLFYIVQQQETIKYDVQLVLNFPVFKLKYFNILAFSSKFVTF